MTTPTPISAHDHGNCELCDQIERDLAAAQEGWKRESDNADKLLTALGLTSAQYRTEGGSLMATKAANAVQETLANLRKEYNNSIDAWLGVERELEAAEARAEGYKQTIDRARRVMGGEGVEDQAQAWDQCLRLLDDAIAEGEIMTPAEEDARYTDECRKAIEELERRFDIELVSIEHHEFAIRAAIAAERERAAMCVWMKRQQFTNDQDDDGVIHWLDEAEQAIRKGE